MEGFVGIFQWEVVVWLRIPTAISSKLHVPDARSFPRGTLADQPTPLGGASEWSFLKRSIAAVLLQRAVFIHGAQSIAI